MPGQPCVGCCIAYPDQRGSLYVDAVVWPAPNKISRDIFRLVETAAALLASKQRHWYHKQIPRQFRPSQAQVQEPPEQRRSGPDMLILEQVQQVAKRAVISAVSYRLTE